MQTDPVFAVRLSPHRSLDRAGIHRLIAFTAVLAAIPGLVFFAMGAWPVVGFLGLDVLVLYWALSTSLEDGAAFETISLWPDRLEWRAVSSRGRESVVSFNPFHVRLAISRDHEGRMKCLRLQSRGRGLEVGRFLNAEDKARFVSLFAPELARARG